MLSKENQVEEKDPDKDVDEAESSVQNVRPPRKNSVRGRRTSLSRTHHEHVPPPPPAQYSSWRDLPPSQNLSARYIPPRQASSAPIVVTASQNLSAEDLSLPQELSAIPPPRNSSSQPRKILPDNLSVEEEFSPKNLPAQFIPEQQNSISPRELSPENLSIPELPPPRHSSWRDKSPSENLGARNLSPREKSSSTINLPLPQKFSARDLLPQQSSWRDPLPQRNASSTRALPPPQNVSVRDLPPLQNSSWRDHPQPPPSRPNLSWPRNPPQPRGNYPPELDLPPSPHASWPRDFPAARNVWPHLNESVPPRHPEQVGSMHVQRHTLLWYIPGGHGTSAAAMPPHLRNEHRRRQW